MGHDQHHTTMGERPDLSPGEFGMIRDLLYNIAGIRLSDGREELVRFRLGQRLRSLGVSTFKAYIRLAEKDSTGAELSRMVDLLTTNKTSFFREEKHFDLLRDRVIPPLLLAKPSLRFWCAGCSSGEEPYSLAMLLRETIEDIDKRDVRILATDISTPVLEKAQEGVFPASDIDELPKHLASNYFSQENAQTYRVDEKIRKMIRFARLNLIAPWPMQRQFDVIFCRNVMIYFDRDTQRNLATRFCELLHPGGYLFIGHSESLLTYQGDLVSVQPATYRKSVPDSGFGSDTDLFSDERIPQL